MAIELEPFYRELGRRIRELRTSKGLTQEDLGGSLEPPVTRASIANIEMGTQRVLAHTLAQLAEHLDTTVQKLTPPIGPDAAIPDEDESIRSELNKQLSIPSKRVDQLVRRLTSSGGKQ